MLNLTLNNEIFYCTMHFPLHYLCFEFPLNDTDVYVFVQTLKGASAYAAANNRPFPKIDFATLDSNHPESFYVFEEQGKPTIIHMPLFNTDNCKGKLNINTSSPCFHLSFINPALTYKSRHMALSFLPVLISTPNR